MTVRERDATDALGESFKRMVGSVRRLRGRETHTRDGISNAQYQLLFGLRGREALSGGELGCLAGLSPATTTQMLEGLEAAGFVERRRCTEDRRKVMTSLTERGQALVEQRHARFQRLWRAALAEFSDEQLGTAAAVMEKLHELFDHLSETDPE